KSYEGPRAIAWIEGWRRSWDVFMPNNAFYERLHDGSEFVPKNLIYLNVRQSLGESVNGVLYVVETTELAGFDRRGWIYDRVIINSALRGVTIEGGDACVYVAKREWTLTESCTRDDAAVRQTYLKIIEEGLAELGSEFRAGYDQSTDAAPSHLLFADRKRR